MARRRPTLFQGPDRKNNGHVSCKYYCYFATNSSFFLSDYNDGFFSKCYSLGRWQASIDDVVLMTRYWGPKTKRFNRSLLSYEPKPSPTGSIFSVCVPVPEALPEANDSANAIAASLFGTFGTYNISNSGCFFAIPIKTLASD